MVKIINTSNEFQELIRGEREFICTIEITLADGTILNLDNERLLTFKFDESTSSDDSFDIGAAIIGSFKFTIDNTDEAFSDYDFTDAKIVPKVGLHLSSTIETLNKGIFTVDEASFNTATIAITAYDNMTKFEKDYAGEVGFPASLQEIVSIISTSCGVFLNSASFTNNDFTVQSAPEDAITYRDLLSYAAQIAGCYAKIDTSGALNISWYDSSAFETESNLYGGRFDTAIPYETGDNAYGGDFVDYTTGDSFDGGTIANVGNYHHLFTLFSQSIDTDDVVITGIRVTDSTEDAESYLYGDEGYVLEISDNPLILSGDAERVATFLGEKMVGLRFRPLTVSTTSNPAIEAGDCAYVSDRKGNSYPCYITNTGFNISGSQIVTCGAKSASRNSAAGNSLMTQVAVKARQEAAKKITSYDLAVQQLTNLITQSFGVYKTAETLEDGSTIYYMHDKPTLLESKTIWKQTANAFAVSEDGGETWNAGMDSSGNAVVNVLSAVGINFDWARGGTLTLGGTDNGNGVLKVYDEDGNVVGTIDQNGLTTSSANITGGTINMRGLNYLTEGIALQSNSPQYRTSVTPLRLMNVAWESVYGNAVAMLSGVSFSMGNVLSGTIDNPTSSSINVYISANGWIQYTTISQVSDRDKKKDINDIDETFARELIEKLTPVEYRFKDGDNKKCLGFIAQDVQELLNPDDYAAVTKERNVENQTLPISLSYTELIAPLIKVVQSQQTEINELKTTLEKVMDFVNYEEALNGDNA